MVSNPDELLSELKEGIVASDQDRATKAAEALSTQGVDPLEVVNRSILPAAKTLGEKFENGEIYLPELMIAADAMKAAVAIILDKLSAEKKALYESTRAGTVVAASVFGDIHDIGKNLLVTLLKVNGFQVEDMGKDVESMKIVKRALDTNADIIALSALMTTTMSSQKEVIDILSQMNVRHRFKVLVGGGSTTREWAQEIGADGWAESAVEGVNLALSLVKKGG
jgi:trimethylamine corrinoid protein